MKNSIFALCLAAAFGVSAGAVTEITDDMTALGDWEITVAAGDSNVVTVAQSGSGKIIKRSAATITLLPNYQTDTQTNSSAGTPARTVRST